MEGAILALKSGAFDYVSKPVDLARLRELVASAIKPRPENSTAELLSAKLIGASPVMEKLREQIRKLARSQAPIYISGESGSGKEMVARMIHGQGNRSDQPFVAVNCGAIPTELVESEFFGHRKGAFTGATDAKPGLFQAADGGTLFLDEVADLPLPMQVKLLRAIQEKSVRPVGDQKEVQVDVRLLSATHRDLGKEVDAGRFRQDLFYRINVIEIKVPALRDRSSDIPLLATAYLKRISTECDMPPVTLSKSATEKLQLYAFPGNVRELENILERSFTLCEKEIIDDTDILLPATVDDSGEAEVAEGECLTMEQPPVFVPDAEVNLEHFLENIEKQAIVKALEDTRWNKTAAAKKLGISFRALRYRLKKLGME
jgi:two-component system response regulator PilR (NtrC family)